MAGSTNVCFDLTACAFNVGKRDEDNDEDEDGLNDELES